MLLIEILEKYDIWEISHKFTYKIYALTNKFFLLKEHTDFSSQLRRASASIPNKYFLKDAKEIVDAEFSSVFDLLQLALLQKLNILFTFRKIWNF